MQLECRGIVIVNIRYVTRFFFYMPPVLTSVGRPTGWHEEDGNGGTVGGHITIQFLAADSLHIFTDHVYRQ